jgi:hypothetical protein
MHMLWDLRMMQLLIRYLGRSASCFSCAGRLSKDDPSVMLVSFAVGRAVEKGRIVNRGY